MASTTVIQLPPEVWTIVFTHLFQDNLVKVAPEERWIGEDSWKLDSRISTNANTKVLMVSK